MAETIDPKEKILESKKSKQKKEKVGKESKPVDLAKEDGQEAVKSKSELKAERRAKQEAQRAAKAAGISHQPAKQQQQQKNAVKKSTSSSSLSSKQKTNDNQQQIKTTEGLKPTRVSDNIQLDDKKAVKRIAKKLAKQQVPQRSGDQKKVNLFSHLYQYEKDTSLTKDMKFCSSTIHPAIIRLGLQYAEGIITGSNARSIALLCAFKQVIADYTTPPSKELSRDLEAKLKPCISFLSQCRHLSVSMGNAIKFLKLQITQCAPELTESEAKEKLLQSIDDFIQVRIILAGAAISNYAQSKINEGDKILIYGYSSLILNVLKESRKTKNFHVIVVDSRPEFPGRESIKRLVEYDIECTYVLINAVSYIMKEVTCVFLGAHALLANGNVMGYAGSAVVAMVAKSNNVPVLTLCETYKFCERVQLDSFVFNELGDPDAIVTLDRPDKSNILSEWRDKKHLYLLNLVYDVTPSSLVDMAITEIGMIPCTSVPVVLRVTNTEN